MSDFNLEDLKQKFGFSGKPLQWQHGFLGMFNQADQHIHGLNQQNKQLRAEVDRLKSDESVHACVWAEDQEGNWDTKCGDKYCLTTGTPFENGMYWCCYCGGSLLEELHGEHARLNILESNLKTHTYDADKFVLVPVEPNQEMIEAFDNARFMSISLDNAKNFNDGYAAMIAAAREGE